MPKCPVCQKRKGKRTCIKHGGSVCSVCCDETRGRECQGCQHHVGQKKGYNYGQVPVFADGAMGQGDEQVMADWVCWALQTLHRKKALTAADAQSLFERVLDVLYFREKTPAFKNAQEKERFTWFTGELMSVVKRYPDDGWTQVIATLRLSLTQGDSPNTLDAMLQGAPSSSPLSKPSLLSRLFGKA